jgi:hypothetical protein
MLEALKNSPEKKELVDAAMKYLRGVKGTLVQQKKRDRDKAMQQAGISNGVSPHNQGRPAPHPGLPTQYHAPPQREVPQVYLGPTYAQPGSVGSHIPGQHTPQSAPRQQQWGTQAQNDPNNSLDERAVESALRGYLGR